MTIDTFKSIPDGLIFSSSGGSSWEPKFDGKYYEMKGSSGITVSLNKVNERMIDVTLKHKSLVVEVRHMTVSADGNRMTILMEGIEKGMTTTITGKKQ